MTVTALCFRLLMLHFTLLTAQVQNSHTQKSDAVFLRITPNRLQHFQQETVTFHCEGSDGSTQLKGTRNTEEFKPECETKRTPTGSSCTIDRVYSVDSGEYWCETKGGERSNRLNITVTAGSVILDSPPSVLEGENVTLLCKQKKSSSNHEADFYKDDLFLGRYSTGQMTIHNVSKSDEGLYKCNISDVGESPGSWLTVRAALHVANQVDPEPHDLPSTMESWTGDQQHKNIRGHHASIIFPSPHEDTLSNRPGNSHVLILMWIAVTILMMALVVVMVGLLYIRKRRVFSKAPTAPSCPGEGDQIVSEDNNDQDNVTYAVVVTKQRKDKDTADTVDNLRLERNQSAKPHTERGEHEVSFEPVCSALTVSETPQALQPEPGLSSSTVTLNPTAATDPNLPEPESLYSPIQTDTKSRDN